MNNSEEQEMLKAVILRICIASIVKIIAISVDKIGGLLENVGAIASHNNQNIISSESHVDPQENNADNALVAPSNISADNL